ncbi:DNA ligase D [Ideonella sp. YS5]|uniref:DNA ligase D n=1 Tax=Ideonella sp. YS5 TaxID=3453714 RepID=UPI003EE9E55B
MPARAAKDQDNPLARYWAKRDFSVTAEPRGEPAARKRGKALSFVVQKHAASRLHYDFRLELDGVLLSWAVPKGPSFDPAKKQIAIHVEDHPLSYGGFEGTIPKGHYGAGTVIVWDRGTWEPVNDPHEGLKAGKLYFRLRGQKLVGLWELVKIAKPGEKQEPWILFKKRDEHARPTAEYDVVSALPDSVIAKPLRSTEPVEPRPRAKAGGDSELPGAVKAPLPAQIGPQLATLATGVPPKGRWVFEIKFDGYRLMARIDGKGRAALITRGGHDWTDRMPALARGIEAMGLRNTWLDGEIVAFGPEGKPEFNALQKALDKRPGSSDAIVYFVFDLPFFEGHDLRGVALSDRRTVLKALMDEKAEDPVRFSADFEVDPATILASAKRLQLEGVIAKRADAPYVSHRSDTWLKLKVKMRQEFVVCGFTDRTGEPSQVGSLILGVYDKPGGELLSVGSVGTGWDTAEAKKLKDTVAPLEIPKPPFGAGTAADKPKPGRWSRRAPGSERWVKPTLVAEVEFGEWTPDGQIRHAVYAGLRADKPATAVLRERPQDIQGSKPARPAGSVRVSHGERVIDESTGLTKLDLVRYYESVAEWILPHLKNRPVSLVRGPTGIGGELFFQKHGEKLGIPGIKELPEALWPGHPALLEIATAEALAGAAQMNVIELHTWNSTKQHIDQPDRIVFDLDPGEGTPWQHVQEAALLVRAMLTELGLEAWLKTSGGKGLHLVVPITPKLDYDTVKDFSQAVVQHLARTIPSRFVAKSGASNRVGKLFVDYLRNGFGATTAAAFSARSRPGLGVSMPVHWEQLPELKSGAQWTIATAREYLSFQSEDPWAGYWKKRQQVTKGMKALGMA